MKTDGLLNPQILQAVAALGHTQLLVIADAGLPVPKGVPVIDVSVSGGIPGFFQVLEAVKGELVMESFIYANEMQTQNPEGFRQLESTLSGLPMRAVAHTAFKALLEQANVIIRTGECSKFANVILIGGTNF